MVKKKKKDDVENYIKQMDYAKWKLKNKDSENLIFEKEKLNRKHFKTFMKSGRSINFIYFIMLTTFTINIYDSYNVSFCYTVTSYWKIFMVFLSILLLIMSLIKCIREINYLFKYRVDISKEKHEYSIPIKSVKKRIKYEKVEAIILLVLLIMGLAITIRANSMSKEDRPNTSLNLSLNELNDKIEGESEDELEIRKTIFAKDVYFSQTIYDTIDKTYYTDRKDKAYLEIEYFSSDYKWVLDRGVKSIYDKVSNYTIIKENNNKKELENWNAEKVFMGENKERIIVYKNSVLSIDGDLDYTKENIDKILKACKDSIE